MAKILTLAEAYQGGHLKQRCSKRVNQAILDVWNLREAEGEVFQARWFDFVRAAIEDFPNIFPYNLVGTLDHVLAAKKMNEELLFLRRLIVALIPNSAEAHCFLGHAYKDIGELPLAAEHYEEAFDLQMAYIKSKHIEQDGDGPSVQWLDAADYLCYLAEAEREMNRDENATIHAVKALEIIRNDKEAEWKKPRPYAILGYIFKDKAKPLAIHYFSEAIKICSENHLADCWFLPEIKKGLAMLTG